MPIPRPQSTYIVSISRTFNAREEDMKRNRAVTWHVLPLLPPYSPIGQAVLYPLFRATYKGCLALQFTSL